MERIKADIKEFGLHVIKVLGDGKYPPFGYSIGIFESYKHPEILIVGLELSLIHSLINVIANKVRDGAVFTPQHFYPGILIGFDCYFTSVKTKYYEEYVQQAINYYNTPDFALLQCIYPTVKNVYPWQVEWPKKIADLQPILGDITNS